MWRKIDGHPYEVNDRGEVKRVGSSELKVPSVDRHGYLVLQLWANNRGRKHYVHRLVAKAFVPGDDSLTVNHIDGNKLNNAPSNLEWITKADNTRHQHATGLASSATQYKPKKIPPEDYERIVDYLQRYDEGEPCDFIALDYNCSQPAISWVIKKYELCKKYMV